MIERRKSKRQRKTIDLPERQERLVKLLAEKHGITETGVICLAISYLADRDGVSDPGNGVE